MHIELSNFEIRLNSSSKIWRNNTCYIYIYIYIYVWLSWQRGVAEHIRHELVPLLESNYFKN